MPVYICFVIPNSSTKKYQFVNNTANNSRTHGEE